MQKSVLSEFLNFCGAQSLPSHAYPHKNLGSHAPLYPTVPVH